MNARIFLYIIIALCLFLTVSNLLSILTAPFRSVLNLLLVIGVIVFVMIYDHKKKCENERYDYDEENPNALVSGTEVAGTVYASYPDQTPGLGWIL